MKYLGSILTNHPGVGRPADDGAEPVDEGGESRHGDGGQVEESEDQIVFSDPNLRHDYVLRTLGRYFESNII
jgi:hypothetical protein